MLGLISFPCQQRTASLPFLASISASSSSSSSASTRSLPIRNRHKIIFPRVFLKTRFGFRRSRSRFAVFSGKNDNGLGENIKETDRGRSGANGSNDDDDLRKERGPIFNFKWGELLFDPDPDNILAVALTGLLAWASVQVLWQLFFISLAILVAALKYSFIAALLIFILITLL